MALSILVDFDGTVASTDASYAVLDRYGKGDWLVIENRAYAHEITILDALKLQALMVKVGPEEASSFLKETIILRPGFRELANWCRENDIHLEICSDGFGWTIEVLLDHWELSWIPWTSNRTIPKEEGWEIEFHHRKEGCPINANCKCSHLERIRERYGGPVIFIGDGTTDECVSKKADVLFARDKLLDICKREGIDCIPWENWDGVFDAIRELIM